MSLVLGCDFSSRAVDLVLLSEDTNAATWRRCELTGQTALDRLRQIPAVMPKGRYYDDVYLCAIETPWGRGQGRTQAVLQRVFGAVVASLPCRLPLLEISPQEWRRELGLKGNATKEECALAVHQLTANSISTLTAFSPQDALDAYGIAYAAREINARAVAKGLAA